MALEGRIGELQAAFRQPLTSALGYINREVFCERLDAARNGQETHIVRMLRAVSLEFWLRDLAARKLIHLPETATIRHKALAVEAQT